ncbi:MAG: ABC transporter ATP-binding protein [Halarsenatibacteraceae bacterium]
MALIEINNLKTYFQKKDSIFHKLFNCGPLIVKAVDGVSFKINKGDTFSLVGESGCGKTTVGRSALRLVEPNSGIIKYKGQDIADYNKKKMKEFRKNAQLILQDPRSSLNPRLIVEELISEPFYIHGLVKDDFNLLDRVWDLLDTVGLSKRYSEMFPHELSGGQARRVGIARALALKPEFIVCDEPTAGLDVSIMSAVLNLMQELQEEFDLTYLWISHNLHVVRHISNKIGVMYLGKLVELGNSDDIFKKPLHPYTQALFSSIHRVGAENKSKKREVLEGEVPSPINPPEGCSFNPRCRYAMKVCKNQEPELKAENEGHFVSCWLYN